MESQKKQGILARVQNSLRGILCAVQTEGSIRLHVVGWVVLAVLGFTLGFSITDWRWVCFATTIAFVVELLNTALEDVCDMYSKEYHPMIKRIKDVASGAVLVSTLACLGVVVSVVYPFFR
ncbi:MAG: diacylglycerol kinase [Patescibacteria group bacterium]